MTEEAPAVTTGDNGTITGDSFFSCFQRDDLWEALAQHPATRPHVADTGFQAAIERLRQGGATQAMASEAMKDPRVMQAVAALQGWGLDVSETDIKHAESVGDLPKRDAVQMGDLEVAHAHGTANPSLCPNPNLCPYPNPNPSPYPNPGGGARARQGRRGQGGGQRALQGAAVQHG